MRTIRTNLSSFGSRWREKIDAWGQAERGHSESSHAQTFWSDLLRQFGVQSERFSLFEKEAVRATSGNTGAIDVFWSGVFIGEAKSVGKNLDAAFDQALDYLAGGSIKPHEFPRFVIVTDFNWIRLTRMGEDSFEVEFPIEEIADYTDQLTFLAGFETVSKHDEADASIEAAKLMARLYAAMTGDADDQVGEDAATDPEDEDDRVEQASIFLTRLLFLLYGDDAGLWREDLFYEFILNNTRDDGSDLGQQLHALFDTLNTPEGRRHKRLDAMMARFPYVNGSVFTDANHLEYFDADMREALLDACRFRWTRISPAVFGSMFQLVKSKEARRDAGEHYTSETNILKTIGPLFLDELRAEADRLIRNKSTALKELRAFRDRLSTYALVDPACGCGNFLVVAYRELRAIETDVIVELRRREGEDGISLDATLETKLTIGQFTGFEINWWPAKIAETAMFLVDHQANRQLAAAVGQAPDRLPIEITAHIIHGNALDLDWSMQVPVTTGATYLFGNPPFLGHATRNDDQAAELRAAWGRNDISRLDYVTAWHAKALQFFNGRAGEWALVTTNSITQGDQVPRLFEPIFAAGWRIKFAHRTFSWNSEAPGKAAVHCVIIGFTRDRGARQRLWEYPDPAGVGIEQRPEVGINAYLVDGPNVLVNKRSTPLSPVIRPAVFGNMPRDSGHLIVEPEEYDVVMADPVAAKYVRPFRGSRELVRGLDRWCLWLVDLDPADVARSPILKERLAAVADFRSRSSAASTRGMAETPHLFGQRSQPSGTYLCLPAVVSESRRYFTAARFPGSTIVSNLAFHVQDPDGLQFALASSSMFLTWQRAIGGRLESRIRFANTLTWNTFPVPALDDKTRSAIVKAGQSVLQVRDHHPDRSLADHYNPLAMDPALLKAHADLDRVVDKALGAPRKLTTEKQRLEVLFSRYLELTA